jgi:glycosyltransferase involved in cell wall biosynthesis
VTPLISVILPTFCVETVIPECLESIRRQTCTDFEVVVVDGGSTDKTVELISAAAVDRRFTIRSEKDTGVYDAMNKGIRLAAGEWLYFLGADDRLHDAHVLQTVAAFIRSQPASHLVYGDVIMRSNISRYAGAFNLDRLLFEKNICHQAIFYRRTVFEKIGDYNLRYPIWADWDLNIRCFQHPAFIQQHLDLVIADYNDTGGISMVEDPVLRKQLPVCIIADAQREKALRGRSRRR